MTLTQAFAINDRFQIVGVAGNRGFLLNLPQPPPTPTPSRYPIPTPSSPPPLSPSPTTSPLPLTCASWTDININGCSLAEWQSTPRGARCKTYNSTVNVNIKVIASSYSVQFANVDNPSITCSSYSGPWIFPQTYTNPTTIPWTLSSGIGNRRVCARFTNSVSSAQCGGWIEVLPTPTLSPTFTPFPTQTPPTPTRTPTPTVRPLPTPTSSSPGSCLCLNGRVRTNNCRIPYIPVCSGSSLCRCIVR